MNFLNVLKRIPWSVPALLFAFGTGSLWLQGREEAAVARAELHRFQDSIRVVDSITISHARETVVVAKGVTVKLIHTEKKEQQAAVARDSTVERLLAQLKASVDSGAVRQMIDSLEQEHTVEFNHFVMALAAADQVHVVDSTTIASLLVDVTSLEASNQDVLRRLTIADKAAHPSLLKRIWQNVPYFIVVGVGGYLLHGGAK